ncbi:hypothetical protein DBR24_15365 [Pseudomonas sp. HMWF006]|nr:hypothetical protein DBR24_15365 [Pseudomonas sp. HMWF006]
MKGKSYPHPSPLPEGEGADRVALRDASTWKTDSVMDSQQHVHVGVTRQYSPISCLSRGERGRPSGLAGCIDLMNRFGYGFTAAGARRCNSPIFPDQSPLPLGEGADRVVLRDALT